MIWKVLVVLFFTVVGGGVYGLFFTTAPVDIAFSILPKETFQISSVDGSLLSGFKLHDLKVNSEIIKLELKELGYLNDFSNGFNSKNKIELNSFFAKDGFIQIEPNKKKKVSSNSMQTDETEKSIKDQKDSAKQKTIKFLLHIVKIDIENIKLILPPDEGMLAMGPRSYHLKRFKLDDFLLDVNSGDKYFDLKVGHHSLETEKFGYQFNNIHIGRRQAEWEQAKLVLSKDLSKSLKQDFSVELQGKLNYDFQVKENFMQTLRPDIKLSAFNDKLKISLNEELQLNLTAINLSPGDFIATDAPIQNISFNAQGNHFTDVMTGRLNFTDVKFSIGEVEFREEALQEGRSIASVESNIKFAGYLDEQKIEVILTPSWYAQVFKPQSKLKIQYQSSLDMDEFMSSQGVPSNYFATN